MHIDYPQKQRLLSHFSDRANWKNVFDAAFFLDDTRKGEMRALGPDLHRFVSKDGTKVELTHVSGAMLTFSIEKDRVLITDESGDTLTADRKGFLSNWAVPEPAKSIGRVFEIPGTALEASFDADGNKRVILGDQAVSFDAPDARPVRPLQKGAQIHVARLDDATAGSWGIPGADIANAVRMVVACDFGLELGIRAFNTIGDYGLKILPGDPKIAYMRPFLRRELTFVQKPWNDTVEFEGYDVPATHTFSLEREDEGFNLITSLDRREAIWSQGDILRSVLGKGEPPIETLSARTQAHHVLRLLACGHTTRDGRGREWNYALVHTKDALDVAMQIRKAMQREFGLTARHCAVLTFDDGLCILAMASKVIDAAAQRSERMRRDKAAYDPLMRSAAEDSGTDDRIKHEALRPL